MTRRRTFAVCLTALICVLSFRLHGQVTADRLATAAKEPQNWLTYSGGYHSHRYSLLDQITSANVANLKLQWAYQSPVAGNWQTTPVVVDGVMYVTQRLNDIAALDAATGRAFWIYRYTPSADRIVCCGANNRGLAILGDTLFLATLDAHLIAIDAKNGRQLWKTQVAVTKGGYSMTLAPLVIKDKVVVGVGGGEYGIRGFIAAFDAKTGREVWRFHTIPGPGEPGHETWPANSPAWERGGGSIWVTGSYDPELHLTYWGVGNPGPDWNADSRPGDNLYTESVVALDPDTGALKWHYQFTPHDTHDWDSNHVPVLATLPWQGRDRDVVMVANRNGFFYVLDRATGELLLGKPFTATTWAREIGADGRPIVLNPDGATGCLPDAWGSTNFNPPSYDPKLRRFFVSARETCASFHSQPPVYTPGQNTAGGVVWADRDKAYGALRALDALTGDLKWEFRYPQANLAGVMSTAAGLVFTGDQEGNFIAFDSASGRELWHYQTGTSIWGAAAMTYLLDGRQYVLIPSGSVLFAFALPR